MHVRGQHNLVPGVVVDVPVILGTNDDGIAFLQLVHIAQRLPVAVAVAGDGEVADLPRHLGGVVMAQTVAIELLERGAFHDVAVPLGAEARNVDLRNQVAIFRVFRLYRRIALLALAGSAAIRAASSSGKGCTSDTDARSMGAGTPLLCLPCLIAESAPHLWSLTYRPWHISTAAARRR